MKKLMIIPVLLFVLINCVKTTHKEQAIKAVGDTVTRKMKPPSTFLDMLVIKEPCAVFYQPDSLQRQKIKAMTEPRIFDASMHDFFFQQANARKFFKQQMRKLRIIEVKNARFLFFIKKDDSFHITDLDKFGDSYGLIVFDHVKDPIQIDMSNVETQAWNYFKRP